MEYQASWNPHFHGNLHTASAYQRKTLMEIAAMMESNLLSLEAMEKYQTWMHREDHLDHKSHPSSLKFFEAEWKDNNEGSDHDGLCQLHPFFQNDMALTIWSPNGPDAVEAVADGVE